MAKRILCSIMMVAMLGFAVTYAAASARPAPSSGIVVGHAVELSTYTMKGLDAEHIETMKFRSSNGFPVGIIEEDTGKLYVCVYRNPAPASGLETANEKLAPFLGQKVAAQGLVYSEKDVKLLRLSIVTEY
jgi:hypothetical protein